MNDMSATETCLAATLGIETRFVEADVYCRLVTSRRCLVRMDDHARGLRGVFDPNTCVHFVVEERKLLRWRLPNRPAATVHG